MIPLFRQAIVRFILALLLWSAHPARAQTEAGATTTAGPQGVLNTAIDSSSTPATAPEPGKQESSPTISASTNAVTGSHVASLATSDLKDYEEQPPAVKLLIARALELTTLNLDYKYGSCDPREGGMDCSGTVYYLLNQAGLKDVPRDSSGMYKWVWTQGRFQAVVSPKADSFEFALLKPGDLLFWTGTYRVDRDPPVTHVMIYLGINRNNGRRVMVGASEGRRFEGKSRYGVSVFDFEMPRVKAPPTSSKAPAAPSDDTSSPRFIGYGSVPGLVQP